MYNIQYPVVAASSYYILLYDTPYYISTSEDREAAKLFVGELTVRILETLFIVPGNRKWKI